MTPLIILIVGLILIAALVWARGYLYPPLDAGIVRPEDWLRYAKVVAPGISMGVCDNMRLENAQVVKYGEITPEGFAKGVRYATQEENESVKDGPLADPPNVTVTMTSSQFTDEITAPYGDVAHDLWYSGDQGKPTV